MGLSVEPESFKAAMRRLAGAVVMVTTRVDGRPWGLTISSCTSLTLEPPQVLVSLRTATASRASAVESGCFGVSFLRAAHAPLAHLGAEAGVAKFIDGFLEGSGPEDAFVDGALAPALRAPMVAGALHHLDCAVAGTFEVSDHTLLVGRVEQAVAGEEAAAGRDGPLLYFARRFHELGEAIPSPTSR